MSERDDRGEGCAECGKELIGDEILAINIGKNGNAYVYVCSPQCDIDYRRDWYMYQSDRQRDDIA